VASIHCGSVGSMPFSVEIVDCWNEGVDTARHRLRSLTNIKGAGDRLCCHRCDVWKSCSFAGRLCQSQNDLMFSFRIRA